MALHKEINARKNISSSQQVKTIYIGGGTPASVGVHELINIIDHVIHTWSAEYLEEISIELNPDPFEETIQLVNQITNHYKNFPRIRFSRGIQTFDDTILQLAGRNYTYNNIKGYLRELQKIKQPINCYNFDFIAFGTLNSESMGRQGGSARNHNKWEFAEQFIISNMADSFSLYMLELFPGSKRESLSHNIDTPSTTLKQCVSPDDELIMEEYNLLSDTIQSAGYKRYEVSNFALPGKNSIHNTVYRTMQPYIGIGASASGMLPGAHIQNLPHFKQHTQPLGVRYTNTSNIMTYINGDYIDHQKTIILQEYDIQYESFMLGLRSYGISDITQFSKILVPQYKEKLHIYSEAGLINTHGNNLKLTNTGYNVANRIISELIA